MYKEKVEDHWRDCTVLKAWTITLIHTSLLILMHVMAFGLYCSKHVYHGMCYFYWWFHTGFGLKTKEFVSNDSRRFALERQYSKRVHHLVSVITWVPCSLDELCTMAYDSLGMLQISKQMWMSSFPLK